MLPDPEPAELRAVVEGRAPTARQAPPANLASQLVVRLIAIRNLLAFKPTVRKTVLRADFAPSANR